MDRIEVLPTIPTDFARAKGWCLNKIPSFGAALGLSATSISSAWGTAWKEMAREAHWCLCTPALWERARGRLAASALGAEKEQRNAVSQGYMACRSQSPRVAFASVLPLKRGLNVQPLSLPAGSRHRRWTSLHFAHPQASWVTFGHNLCACLGWLVSLKTRVLKGSDISVVLPVENTLCQVCAPAGVLGPAGGRQRPVRHQPSQRPSPKPTLCFLLARV